MSICVTDRRCEIDAELTAEEVDICRWMMVADGSWGIVAETGALWHYSMEICHFIDW